MNRDEGNDQVSSCPSCQSPLFYDHETETAYCDNCDFEVRQPAKFQTLNGQDPDADLPDTADMITWMKMK